MLGRIWLVPSEATNEQTKQEWRELGFFYERDDEAQSWKLVGSKTGLLSFAKALRSYASATGDSPGEHRHYGPYWYLTVTTWTETEIIDRGICGPLEDLARLAGIIESKVDATQPGSSILIGDEFATRSSYALVLEVMEEGFDPSTADPELSSTNSSLIRKKRKDLTTDRVRGPSGWIPYFGLEAFGQSINHIKEWRAGQPEGEPNGLKDFYEAFGLCFDCHASGVIPAGPSPPSAEEIAEYSGKLPGLLPAYEQCTTCGGTGKAPRTRWKSTWEHQSDSR